MQVVTRRNLESALSAIESQLAGCPNSIDLQADRARLLFELGETEQAKRRYLEILRVDHRHFSTLNNFAVLLQQTGQTSAANLAYRAAIANHPSNPIGHTNFADLLVCEGKLDDARSHYETALQIDPGHVNAHRGLAVVYWDLGDAERARQHQALQYQNEPIQTFPYLGTGDPIGLLVLMSAGMGNLPWLDLIDNRVFLIITVATEFYDPKQRLPPHRLVFNTIGDADVCEPALGAARTLVGRTNAPVINSPDAVLATGRIANAQRLRGVPGVVTPRIILLPREVLAGADGPNALRQHEFHFPLLLRRPGFHTGRHFVRVENATALAAAASELPAEELMVIEYLDARARDGKSRKYRVMSIDGQLFPLHLAISDNWKVHYFSAAMSGNPAHQAEEAAFLNDMPAALGPKAMRALEQIQDTLGLDYGGIDFGLGQNGEVLLFEANATMLIQLPGRGSQWDYRRPAIGRALEAARNMLFERAGVQASSRV